MGDEVNDDIQEEIQRQLALICDISLKIKRELEAVENLSRDKGILNNAVHNANGVLAGVVKDMGLEVPPDEEESDREAAENHMVLVTPDYITEKLMNIINATD